MTKEDEEKMREAENDLDPMGDYEFDEDEDQAPDYYYCSCCNRTQLTDSSCCNFCGLFNTLEPEYY